MKALLKCTQLSKEFHDPLVCLFKGLSFQLSAGGSLLVLGPNGAGKSTLLKILAGQLVPDSGELQFMGEDFTVQSHDLRRRIGFVPAGAKGLFPNATVRENLLFYTRIYELAHKEAQEQISNLSQEFKIEEYLDVPLQKLSQGYQRRVSLVRALLHQPQVLLLDEPFAFLDAESVSFLISFLNQWRSQKERGLVLTSHIELEALKEYDQIWI